MASHLTYAALDKNQDGLRLLILDPRSDSLSCKFEYHAFASRPVYEAISYARGQTSLEVREIIINGQPLLVPQNIYDILGDLRASNAARAVWIDAICINQADVQERNHQTNLMYLIFSRAQRVLAHICHPLQPIKKPADQQSFQSCGHNAACTEAAGASPYWQDLWAVQDIVCARNLLFYVGSYALTAEEFTETILYNIPDKRKPCETFLQPKLEQLRYRYDENMEHNREDELQDSLEVLVEKTKDRTCAETRDRIFALLSFAIDWSDDVLRIDYDVPFAELYTQAMHFHQTRPPRTNRNVSDWPKTVDRQLRLVAFSRLIQQVLAGRVEEEVAAGTALAGGPVIYQARCVLEGEITLLGPTYKQCISSFRANNKWKKDLEDHYRDQKQQLSEARMSDEKYETIWQAWDESYIQKLRSVKSSISYGFKETAAVDETLLSESDLSDPQAASTGPKRFLGSNGITGFAPSAAEKGDQIATFWGCDVAILLREVEQDRWSIVGRADMAPVEKSRRNEYSSWHSTMMYDEGKPYMRRPSQMMTLRLDVATLQKLTC